MNLIDLRNRIFKRKTITHKKSNNKIVEKYISALRVKCSGTSRGYVGHSGSQSVNDSWL